MVQEIRTAVLDGTSYYFIRLEENGTFYAINAADNRDVITLDAGDLVTIDHAIPTEGSESSILDGCGLAIHEVADPYYPNGSPVIFLRGRAAAAGPGSAF